MKNKILITGGHAGTTALAVIEEIKKRRSFDKIAWIGNQRAIEAANINTIESRLFRDLEIDYNEINSGRIQRKWSKNSFRAILRIPKSFIHSFLIVQKYKPQIVLSFGGAVSTPVCFAAWIMGIPVVIHEQTIAIGLANRISSVFAEKIALARLESKKYFKGNNTIHVGNPINKSLRNINRDKVLSKKPTIYITGGSRGSQRINKVIFDSLSELEKSFKIIHQTGELDYKKAKKHKSSYYEPVEFVHPKKLKKILQDVDIVISRSGANTVAELIAFEIPSILIPIPWTRYDEQTKNAKLAVQAGIAILMTEDQMSTKVLLKNINKIVKNYKKFSESKRLKTTEKDIYAHENLTDLVENVLQ